VHPRDVDAHFSHGTVTNYWGGSSNATTHLLDALHYQGRLRVVRRDRGIRVYAVRDLDDARIGAVERRARMDALADVLVRKYAPLPAASLSMVISRLRYAAPQWRADVRPAIDRAKRRLAHVRIDGVTWYWPADERPPLTPADDRVHLLAPFDPIVWDRRRFELLWGWPYRFEAYTPAAKRTLGYYALPDAGATRSSAGRTWRSREARRATFIASPHAAARSGGGRRSTPSWRMRAFLVTPPSRGAIPFARRRATSVTPMSRTRQRPVREQTEARSGSCCRTGAGHLPPGLSHVRRRIAEAGG
jgi:hypothetical protein